MEPLVVENVGRIAVGVACRSAMGSIPGVDFAGIRFAHFRRSRYVLDIALLAHPPGEIDACFGIACAKVVVTCRTVVVVNTVDNAVELRQFVFRCHIAFVVDFGYRHSHHVEYIEAAVAGSGKAHTGLCLD